MSATVARLEAVLTANTRDFDQAMNRSEGKMHKLGNVAKLGGVALAAGLAYGLEKSVHAAMEAQVSQERLRQAFIDNHLSLRAYQKQLESTLSAGRKLAFSDNDQRQALGSLLTALGNVKDARKQLSIAEDLARFKGVSLGEATKALTMLHAGSTRALKQLGIQTDKVTEAQDRVKDAFKKHSGAAYDNALAIAKVKDKQATLADTLNLVNEKVKGQSQAYAGTAQGGLEVFRVQIQHVEELVGGKLLDAFFKVETWLRANWPEISKVLQQTWVTMQQVWANIKPTLLALMDLAVSVVQAIRKHWGTIGPIVMGVVAIIRAQLQIVTGVIKFFAAVLRGDWAGAWNALKGVVNGVFNEIKAILGEWKIILVDIAKALGHAIVEGLKLGLSEAEKLLKAAVVGLFHKVIDWVKSALGIHSPSAVFHDIGVSMIKGMVNGIGSMGGYLKQAVLKLAKSIPSKIFGALNSSNQNEPGHLVAQVVRALAFARGHGWHGQVTSGYRTYAEQARLYERYLAGGPLAAAPGTSSHEFGQAVDVTDVSGFARAMQMAPALSRLYNKLGSADPVHFSVSGYDMGGWLPTGLSLAMNNTGRPERVLGPGDGGDTYVLNAPNFYGSNEALFAVWRAEAAKFKRRGGRL